MRPLSVITLGVWLLSVGAIFADSREEEAKRYLKELQTAKDAKTKVNAATELGKLGQIKVSLGQPAIPALLEALKDKDATVRAAAASALGRLEPDPEKALPALMDLVKNDKEDKKVRLAAANGLASMGPAAQPIVRELQSIAKKETENDRNFGRSLGKYAQAISGKKK